MKLFKPQHVILGLTFLCAANGFLVETILTQTIAASLGGTVVQYQFAIGLFVFSLGMGSLSYPTLCNIFDQKRILLFSIGGLAFLSIGGPFLIHSLGQTWGLTLASPMAWLAYAPLVMVGFITGLDLPTLLFIGQKNGNVKEETVLGLDYMGMFLIGLVFPLAFSKFGLVPLVASSLIVSLISLAFLLQLPNIRSNPSQTAAMPTPGLSILLICFLLSFCSISYELILARWMVDFFENEIFALNYTIGFYLVGLGLGSIFYRHHNSSGQLLKIEFSIVLSILAFPFLSYFFASFWKTHFIETVPKEVFQLMFLAFASWIGYWSGKELPYLMNVLNKHSEQDITKLFFWNYLGALFASIIISLFLIPTLGLQAASLLVVFLNLLTVLAYHFYHRFPKGQALASCGLLTLAAIFLPPLAETWEQIYLKSIYNQIRTRQFSWKAVNSFLVLDREINDIRRIVTPYQTLDLVRTEIPTAGNGMDDLQLYINQQPQFSLFTHELYHDSFSYGAINLHGEPPKNALVLGGGDGLLLRRLNEIKEIESVTLIELDPKMIELAKQHLRISKANNNAFSSAKVDVVIDDAFSWLKQNAQLFDGIFIDFPYPTNYELSRLYSVEFYTLVARHLQDNGFIVLNAPISFNFDEATTDRLLPTQTLLNTLKQAGFRSLLPFGSREPFIYAEKRLRPLGFNYQQLPDNLANASFINLVPIRELLEISNTQNVNSIYRPRKLVTW